MGGSGSRLGRATNTTTPSTNVSPTSTGGVIRQESSDQWYGENDNGYAVSILDGGRDPMNEYRYGSAQIYEVHRYTANGASGDTLYVPTKSEAMARAKAWLKDNK